VHRFGPVLILVIGVLSLVVAFAPGLRVPDASSPDGTRLITTKLGLDLSGGIRIQYQVQAVDGRSPTAEDLAVMRKIVEQRVNAIGVAEPVIMTMGSDRIVVEMPGVTDPEAVRRLVGQTGRLDFVPLGNASATAGQKLDLGKNPPLFGGDQVASATLGQDQTGGLSVDFVLESEGAVTFARFTEAHIGETFAITLDGTVISAPVIRSAIPNGQVQITGGGIGGFDTATARNLVDVLRFGALPFPLVEVSYDLVGASLD